MKRKISLSLVLCVTSCAAFAADITLRDKETGIVVGPVSCSEGVEIALGGRTYTISDVREPSVKAKALEAQLAKLNLGAVDFQDVALSDAIDYLRHASGKQVNILVQAAPSAELPWVNLSLRDIPLLDALRYVARVVGGTLRIDDHAAIIDIKGPKAPNRFHVDVNTGETAVEGQFVIAFRISEVVEGGKTNVLSAPRLTVLEGKEGRIAIADAAETDGIFCSAVVHDRGEKVESHITVEIKRENRTLWFSSQRTTVNR